MSRDDVMAEWRTFIDRLPPDKQLKPFILHSWQRSREAGVVSDPDAVSFRQVPEEELRRRLKASRQLVALARPHLSWLSASLGETVHVAYVTDGDGIVLHAEGHPAMKQAFRIIPGYDWSERQMGTNGAGTALATDRPVAVVGPEHYSSALHDGTCTGAPVHGPDGRIIGAIDLSTSVADGRPERLSLVAHVAFTIETELARQQAQQNHRRVSEFLATLAHELRNPLAPLLYAVELLEQPDPNISRDQLHATIRQQVEQMTRLIEDLNDAARADRGKLSLRKQPMDLRDAIRAAMETTRPRCKQAGLHLKADVAEQPLPVHGDLARLTQTLVNLLTNACKFTAPSGRIHVTARAEGDDAVIRVADTGIGIPPDKLEQIFDFFVQVHEGPQASGGLGIGLALVQSMVRLHGGQVHADSKGENLGSTFTITLPLSTKTEALPLSNGDRSDNGRDNGRADRPLRIMVVEDSKAVGPIFTKLLEMFGHEVVWVRDAEQAMRQVFEVQPHVICSDLSLPGLSGYELARQVRQHPALAHTHLMAVTGYDEQAVRDQTRDAGFDHHLVKPVELDQLRELLDSLVIPVGVGDSGAST